MDKLLPQREKEITIKDIDREFTFKVKLFSIEEGTRFFCEYFSVMKFTQETLESILTLASLKQIIEGKETYIDFDLQQAYAIFKSPIAIYNLADRILNFQIEVFTNSKS